MFLYPSLLWIGLPLIGLPILIHLINLLRHRRVKWAAMDFLIQSQRKHRNWILLKQLLLLLLRMSAIAALALLLAQPVLRGHWASWIGGAKTHHVLLLDDSFSMTDRFNGGTAFERAKRFVQQMIDRAASEPHQHTLSLLRFSKSRHDTFSGRFDLVQETIDATLSERIEELFESMECSQTDAGPIEALDRLDELPEPEGDTRRVVYIVSDFRRGQWEKAAPLEKRLQSVADSATEIHLVDCVRTVRPNRAVVSLKPRSGIRAAGVEMEMELAVRNFGDSASEPVVVKIQEDGHARPGILLDSIPPGQTASSVFRVHFSSAGHHTLAASLESDAVLIDNARYWAEAIPEKVPVLVVDSAPDAPDAYFVSAALAPDGKAMTGIAPRIEPPQFLRNHDQLADFAAIFLLNVDRIDAADVQALESYVSAGGGVAFFLGERSRADFFNQHLYRQGEGLFPVPLDVPTNLLRNDTAATPDVSVSRHPVFSVFAGQRNNFLNTVMVDRYFQVPDSWKPDEPSDAQVIARLRNGAPLVVEKQLGDGRVVAFLSKAAPEETTQGTWNNWGKANPSYVVTMLELAGYLAHTRHANESLRVGQPLIVDAAEHQPAVRFSTPAPGSAAEVTVDARPNDDRLTATLNATDYSGFYEAHLTSLQNREATRVFACNVNADEGDLDAVPVAELGQLLDGVQLEIYYADELDDMSPDIAGVNLSDTILFLLVGLLLGEQILAYSASYHPPRSGARR